MICNVAPRLLSFHRQSLKKRIHTRHVRYGCRLRASSGETSHPTNLALPSQVSPNVDQRRHSAPKLTLVRFLPSVRGHDIGLRASFFVAHQDRVVKLREPLRAVSTRVRGPSWRRLLSAGCLSQRFIRRAAKHFALSSALSCRRARRRPYRPSSVFSRFGPISRRNANSLIIIGRPRTTRTDALEAFPTVDRGSALVTPALAVCRRTPDLWRGTSSQIGPLWILVTVFILVDSWRIASDLCKCRLSRILWRWLRAA